MIISHCLFVSCVRVCLYYWNIRCYVCIEIHGFYVQVFSDIILNQRSPKEMRGTPKAPD